MKMKPLEYTDRVKYKDKLGIVVDVEEKAPYSARAIVEVLLDDGERVNVYEEELRRV